VYPRGEATATGYSVAYVDSFIHHGGSDDRGMSYFVYQKSFDEGIVPSNWKEANVSPIFKKGKRTDAENYRPVSLTCVPCKVMESIVRDFLLAFLEGQDILSKFQHGFTKGRSCLTNLLETLETWTRLLDDGYGIDVIYLDYKKAFDTVSHEKLREKLRPYRITGKMLEWITEFLQNRIMRVGVHGSFSEWVAVLSGIPRGQC